MRRNRIPQTLQIEPSHRAERVAAARPRQQPHQLRDQDLPTLGGTAQTSRFHHRHPEVIAVLHIGVTTRNPNPHQQRVAVHPPIPPGERQLYPHRCRHRVRRTRERHHQPVAQVLHLTPAGPLHHSAQQPEMLPPHLITPLLPQPGQQCSRIDQIGKHHSDRLNSHGSPSCLILQRVSHSRSTASRGTRAQHPCDHSDRQAKWPVHLAPRHETGRSQLLSNAAPEWPDLGRV